MFNTYLAAAAAFGSSTLALAELSPAPWLVGRNISYPSSSNSSGILPVSKEPPYNQVSRRTQYCCSPCHSATP
ncbi:hypothetical protein M434DRAFT_123026 [Hypoxylon sp. CO27-5]|nr:hypothetical protein M434DRAFT_123026 [Hypoxylon sp. CO27-5]